VAGSVTVFGSKSTTSGAEEAPVSQPESLRGQGAHLSDRVFQPQNLLLPHVLPQDARVVPIAARVGDTRSQFPDAAVAGDHRIRVAQEGAEVIFVHAVEDRSGTAVQLDLQD
jgi:hypothetical protein